MSFEVPEDLYYLETHEWIDPETGRVGITDFAQDELGDVVFVELPDVGTELDREEQFGVVESIKAVSDLYSPASGEVRETNDELEEAPELVNEAPFEGGWMLALADVDEAELDDVLTAAEYRDQIE